MSFFDDLRAEILGGPPDAWTFLSWLGDVVNHRAATTPVVLHVDGNPREINEVTYDEDVEAIFVQARREIGWGGRYAPAAMVAVPVEGEPVIRNGSYETLAAIQHEIWSHWMRYLLDTKGQRMPDGGVLLDPVDVVHWQAQIDTPYAGLTEAEKDSDREQVDRFWSLFEEAPYSPPSTTADHQEGN